MRGLFVIYVLIAVEQGYFSEKITFEQIAGRKEQKAGESSKLH